MVVRLLVNQSSNTVQCTRWTSLVIIDDVGRLLKITNDQGKISFVDYRNFFSVLGVKTPNSIPRTKNSSLEVKE